MVDVVVIDDHPSIRAGVRAMLQGIVDVSVVGDASSHDEALKACTTLHPDIALVDLRLGVDDGVAVIESLARQCPSTRAIVLTTFEGDETLHRALEAGAWGYLLKDATAEEMTRAILTVSQGRRSFSERTARRLAESAPRIILTGRENDVLLLLAEGMRNKEIAARLGMGEATVRTHVQSIIEKFGCHDRGAAIAKATARGFFATRQNRNS